MIKEKHNLYWIESFEELNAKTNRIASRLFFFILGFLFALLLIVVSIIENGKQHAASSWTAF